MIRPCSGVLVYDTNLLSYWSLADATMEEEEEKEKEGNMNKNKLFEQVLRVSQ
jgi:hypothetical protein